MPRDHLRVGFGSAIIVYGLLSSSFVHGQERDDLWKVEEGWRFINHAAIEHLIDQGELLIGCPLAVLTAVGVVQLHLVLGP